VSEPNAIPTARARASRETDGKPPWWPRLVHIAMWLLVALPALYQIGLLVVTIYSRYGYPYDLEWMEGGMLHHAQRIRDGTGIYVPPSVDFIPYLYTPLYPSLLALFGGAFGVTYQVGRGISIAGLIGIASVAILAIGNKRHQHLRREAVWGGLVLALGLFAAIYPYVEGWYDLVRADTFFLFLATAGIAALPRWAQTGEGFAGHGKVAAGAAVLTLAFFTKQTGIIYVGLGGAIVAVLAWRRAPIYIATAGIIGGGGTLVLNATTHGWYWTYVSKIHRTHDFNMDRFWKSFGNILWHFPMLTIVVAATLILAGVTWWRRRELPIQTRPLMLWSVTFAVSTIVGAVGWGTEFAHFNAYMPAFLHGALAAGSAVPAAYACARFLWGERKHPELVASGAALAVAIPLALTCLTSTWRPKDFIPTETDVAAGDRLIARLRTIKGEVWMPSHPWYLYMAGKTPRVHRMGIKDVTTRSTRIVEGLDLSLEHHAFTALALDNRDVYIDVPAVQRYYRPALKIPASEQPHLYTGAGSVPARNSRGEALLFPDSIWVPAIPATPPPGAKMVFDFEAASWDNWTPSGAAWGKSTETAALRGQELVLGATGMRFATSMHGGDSTIGRMTSPPFLLDGARLTMHLGGTADPAKLYVALVVDDVTVETAVVPNPGGDTLQQVPLAIPDTVRGKLAKLVLVDESTTGHLDVDDIWIWQ
jgi:hypothetical protein